MASRSSRNEEAASFEQGIVEALLPRPRLDFPEFIVRKGLGVLAARVTLELQLFQQLLGIGRMPNQFDGFVGQILLRAPIWILSSERCEFCAAGCVVVSVGAGATGGEKAEFRQFGRAQAASTGVVILFPGRTD